MRQITLKVESIVDIIDSTVTSRMAMPNACKPFAFELNSTKYDRTCSPSAGTKFWKMKFSIVSCHCWKAGNADKVTNTTVNNGTNARTEVKANEAAAREH